MNPNRAFKIVTGYTLTACLVSWVCWLPLCLSGPSSPPTSPLNYLHLLGSLGPAISGLIWSHLAGGASGARSLCKRIFRWRVHPGLHLVAWGGPFLLMIAAHSIAQAMGAPAGLQVFTRSPEYPDLPILAYWAAVLVFYGFGEEVGWRGFALPTLRAQLSPVNATLFVTLIWALWHAPLFAFSPGLSSLGLGGSVGWLLSLTTGSFLLTWLTDRARGSILIAAGFHATMDIAFLGSQTVMMIVGALTTLLGVAAMISVARSHPAT